ncbi:hypothetical protein SPHINGO8AM_80278 [Sphingomonas sp. 8AM]|nr:hypothetical protein SPHINGO8AM_80278 [Sphingomonas sp. 8AM]
MESLKRQLHVLEVAAAYLGPHYPARRLQALFYIAKHEPVLYQRLWVAVDSLEATVRRDIDALTGERTGAPLVVERPGDNVGRHKVYWLTDRGREAVWAIAAAVTG